MPRSTRDAARSLRATAQEQGGYFTAKQARRSGYDYPHLEYHVSTGAFERVGHGLYRLTSIPPAGDEDLIRLSLWSRDREDQPQAVVSHQSALILYDLTDILPSRIHLTVPPGFRKDPPEGCTIHKAVLLPADVEERTGFRVTTPLRTLLDVSAGTTSAEQLEKAVIESLARGLVRRTKIIEAARSDARYSRLEGILEHQG